MELLLTISDDSMDVEQLDLATGRLARELKEVGDADAKRVAGGSPPPGAKGTGLEVATLAVALADSSALAAIISSIRSWLGGRSSRRITIKCGDAELSLDGASQTEVDRLVDAWLERCRPD